MSRSLSQLSLMLVLATPIAPIVMWQTEATLAISASQHTARLTTSQNVITPTRTVFTVSAEQLTQTISGRTVEGDRIFQQKQLLGQRTQDLASKTQAIRLFKLGEKQFSEDKYQEALISFQNALSIWQKIKNRGAQADVLHKLGQTYEALGQYPKSLENYRHAVEIFLNLNEAESAAGSLSGLGMVHLRVGEYYRAIKVSQQSLRLFPEGAVALSNIGISHGYLGQHEKALKFHKQALKIRRARQSTTSLAVSLTNLGVTYNHLARYKEAFRAYQEASTIFKKNNHFLGQAISLNGMGETYNLLDQHDKAMNILEEALQNSQRANVLRIQGNILNNIGLTHKYLGQSSEALKSYERSFSIYRKINDREGQARILTNIAKVFNQKEQSELAIVFLKQSVEVYESIRGKIPPVQIDLQESYVKSVANTYRSLADLLLAQGRVLEAQQVLELLKIQELRDFSRDTRAGGETQGSPLTPRETPIPPAFTDKIALGQKLIACDSQKPRCAERESLQAQVKTANNRFNQLADRLRSQQTDKDPAQLQRDELTLAAQKVVLAQPKTVLIYPLVLEDKLWLVWGSQAGSKGVVFDSKEVLVSRKELAATVVRFRQLLERPGNVQELQQVSQKLYGWLIKPIRSQLDANGIQNLVFSLDRATRYIPMSALYDGRHYLVEKFNLSTILTAGTTDTSDKLAANPANTKVLGMGLSNAVTGFNPLPNVVDELDGIVRSQPGDRTGIFPGSKFLNQAFDRRAFNDLIDYRILHIATHGKFVSGQPEDSFLVLGNGDPLRIPEIKSMTDLNAIHLVVLSACETAKGGEDKEGLEVSGISYYFITSGAKAVIASLWLVNDASTALMMQQFYQNLPKGMSKTEALRQVQLQFIQGKLTAKNAPQRSDINPQSTSGNLDPRSTNSDFSHPYYWAPFILIGNSL
jgi:CHAT domain-containing protein